MHSLIVVVLLASVFLPVAPGQPTAQAADCEFVLGFKTLHDLIPDVVGNCLDNVQYVTDPTLSRVTDGVQHTTNGMLVWRWFDNVSAFTNGYQTWLLGPFGLETRLNTQLLPWEQDIQNAVQLVSQKGYKALRAVNYNPAGKLHVLVGFQVPTADAHNQNAFFFADGAQFLGTDTADTSADEGVVAQTSDTVTISYVLYNPSDPMCCPTAGKADVRYFYDGVRVTPLDPIPPSDFNAAGSRR